MSENTTPTPDQPDETSEATTGGSVRRRLTEMPEKRRTFLAGLAVGAAVLGGAWGITSAVDGDHDHHRGSHTDNGGHHRDRGDHDHGGMDGHGAMDGHGGTGGHGEMGGDRNK